MTTTPGAVIQAAVPVFRVNVAVRDGDRDRFSKSSDAYEVIASPLTPILELGLSISYDELFSYAICQELADLDGHRTRQELANRIPGLRSFVLRDLPATGGSLALTGSPGKGVVEYIGVGVGLALMDRLLAIDSTYFRRIGETSNSKTMDFDGCFRASTGAAYVQLEVKGRINSNNVAAAWRDIDAKKTAFRAGTAPARPGHAPLSPGTPTHLIGTVADIPLGREGTTRIIIGDPPIPSFGGDPLRAKLLQRLRFYQRVLSVFQPRGALLAALSDRIGSIERAGADWLRLNEQAIVNWRMEEWVLSANIANTVKIGRLDQLHGRSVFPVGSTPVSASTPFYFVGLHRNVLLALARQNFEEIRDRRYDQRHVQAAIDGATRVLYQAPSGLIISSFQSEFSATVQTQS